MDHVINVILELYCTVKMTSGASGSTVGPVKSSASWKGEGRAHFPFCPEISKYEKLAKVGQGTFG